MSVKPVTVKRGSDIGGEIVVWRGVREGQDCNPYSVSIWQQVGIQLSGTFGTAGDPDVGLMIEGSLWGFAEENPEYVALREAGLPNGAQQLTTLTQPDRIWKVFDRVSLIRPRVVDGTGWDLTVRMILSGRGRD